MRDTDATKGMGPLFGVARERGSSDITTERVIFGIDFGPASLGAARWAVSHLTRPGVARPAEFDACVAHVVPWPGDASVGGDDDSGIGLSPAATQAMQRLRPALLGGLAGVAASLRLDGARPVLRAGRPSSWLEALVALEGAQQLVLGRRRDSARHRIGEPNVIERVTRRAACDVLVVPEGAVAPVTHVIAPVDASPRAGAIVARAAALAHKYGATLTLVHVLAPYHGSYDRLLRPRRRADGAPAGDPSLDMTAQQDSAYARLAALARDVDPSLSVRLSVPVGDAAREISAVAMEREAAAIVLGKRGADDAPAGSLGSVARELLKRGPCPVLAVEC